LIALITKDYYMDNPNVDSSAAPTLVRKKTAKKKSAKKKSAKKKAGKRR
jgi:hypothetical protein